MLGKIDAPLNQMLNQVEWGTYRVGDLFEIEHTLSFNSEKLNVGTEFDYITRTSLNQGILQTTGFVNADNINSAGNWSLGLLQMDFFYRTKPWYAGQFVRKITTDLPLTKNTALFFTVLLNSLKHKLLSVLVRDVDKTFREQNILLPTKNGEIDFAFMERFVAELEAQRVAELEAYLTATGLKDYELTAEEQKALDDFENHNVSWKMVTYQSVFDHIKQGRRLRKEDQFPGSIPFVMAGTTNTGVVGYISNPVASFPKNSITIDIFGNSFYRNYAFGAGDDTGVYWSTKNEYSSKQMLFFTSTMEKSIAGKFSYGKKLRSSQSLNIKMYVPVTKGNIDLDFMDTLISAIQKLIIKDVVQYSDRKIAATKQCCKSK